MTTNAEWVAAVISLGFLWIIAIQFPPFRPSRWCRLIGRAFYSLSQGLGAFEEVMALGTSSAFLAFKRVTVYTWTQSRALEVTND